MDQKAKAHSLGIDAIFQYSGAVARALSGLLFYVVIDRLFDTTSVGAVALLLAIIGIFYAIFSLGLGPTSEHFISSYMGENDLGSARKTVDRILVLSFLASIAGVAIMNVFSPEISILLFHNLDYIFYVRVTSIVLFATVLFEIFNKILLGLQKFRESAIMTVLTWISYYSIAVIFSLVVRSLLEIIIGWIIGMTIGVIIEFLIITRSISSFANEGSPPDSHVFYSFMLPVLFSGLMGFGSFYSDRIIVAGLLSLSQLGIYNFVLLFASTMLLITSPFSNILMPKFSKLFGKGERDSIKGYVRGSILLLLFLYVPIALGIAAISPILLGILGGDQYTSGATALIVIMFLAALSAPQYVLMQAVLSVRRTSVFLISGPVPLATNIALSLILIPMIGLTGAALGFSSVNISILIIFLHFSRKEHLLSFDFVGALKIWAASLTMFFLMYLTSYLAHNLVILIPLYIAVGFFVYMGVIRALRTFSGSNGKLVSALFPSHNGFYKLLSLVLNSS